MCEFFKKHDSDLNETCKILITNYCLGNKKNLCHRLIYFTAKNKMPSPDMAPNGIDLGKKK